MILAYVASALSYFLLSVSTSLPLLFLSRLPSVFMHAMQGKLCVMSHSVVLCFIQYLVYSESDVL